MSKVKAMAYPLLLTVLGGLLSVLYSQFTDLQKQATQQDVTIQLLQQKVDSLTSDKETKMLWNYCKWLNQQVLVLRVKEHMELVETPRLD